MYVYIQDMINTNSCIICYILHKEKQIKVTYLCRKNFLNFPKIDL